MDERLRHFKAVVEARGITIAARRLHMSQPALSISIAKLEKELKATLLLRSATFFRVTDAGQAAYDYAVEQTSRKNQFIEQLALHAGKRAILRIGVIDSVAGMLCQDPELLPSLEQRFHVSMVINDSSRLAEAVRRQEVDYALVVGKESEQPRGSLHSELIGHEPLLDVMSLPYLMKDPRLISYTRGSATHDIVQNAFATVARSFQPAMYSTSPEVMLQLVLLGRGHAVLPYNLVKDDLAKSRLTMLAIGKDGYAKRPIHAMYTRQPLGLAEVRSRLQAVLRAQEAAATQLAEPLFE